ncbi:MetQ/NlpA family ABC transporter substrate-binding protein [Halalkalibacterium halodurans]|uniref:MetQ/NlpA family ABC transporter substrate-binding protein n=1 Tax=Halalkalibacterium halodurans TaxID=86665 RepID=UPI002AAA1869|nr:MetQ/NlpA family ABC transporter substrate-binding protein [Halalkalibacterium halodurans]MDY7224005.1 MetQ/NlpA family ABC transporter substrate-binding protein [Halalkalibacterium halodurans]MDY7243290.1 MetQ/NlpA family ABC transporter substrate-binding protein [Halalkalibacterium halodurans]MED4080157.1 MetQ/NlpA family ABC transporter substrate-binding protein [Halalkalibacterium halodurans]MED4083380.1 MetQ/NlpA family ABC transporter substrate-binding protein [Halalkalibacterium halod
MKKFLSIIGAATLSLSLVACGGTSEEDTQGAEEAEGEASVDEPVTIKIGASAVPHTEVLEFAAPLLEERGITLEIETFTDYILPNTALRDGDIDVNYFQTPGYLAQQIEEYDYDFVSLGKVHAEPIGIYSKEYSSLEELPEGAEIIFSDSISDHGRILPIFERAGLIELDVEEGELATIDDISSNPKNLVFGSQQVEARFLAPSFENGEGDAVAINTNYALEGGVDIEQYGIAFESEDVLQPNLIVVRAEDQDRPEFQVLVEVLQSEEVRQFIEEQYNGAVIPMG